jgi:hypothetical protein
VTTNDATLVEETSATFNGVQTGLTGATCGFIYSSTFSEITPPGTPTKNVTCSGTYDSGVPFNYVKPVWSLTTGTYYYVRAWTYKSGFGYTYDTDYKVFLTKPNPPFSLTKTIYPTNITIGWISSGSSFRSYFRYKIGSYPTDRTDGTLICNLTGDHLSVPPVYANFTYLPSTTYYIRGWAYVSGGTPTIHQWSDTTLDGTVLTPPYGATMYVLTMPASSIEESTATLNGVMTGDNNTVCGFLINNGVTYSNRTCAGTYDSGETFSYPETGLLYGDLYTFRAWSKNTTSGHFNYSATILTFLTKPIPPASETPVFIAANDSIRVNWSKSAVGPGTTQKT